MGASLGIIEGFYGRVWSWQQRADMLAFMAAHDFSSYWYAPKADACLRKHWQQNWSTEEFSRLLTLSEQSAQAGVQFGVGLSPLGLYDLWRQGDGREQLRKRLTQIAALQPKGLALLFDDMQGDLPFLAETQAEIAHFVADELALEQMILCPSYYSFDPILEQLFGKMPDHYLHDLGTMLDADIDIFWTGDKVISTEYPAVGLQAITQILQRKPVIWDNSIVNDGRKTSPFLTLRSMYVLEDFQQQVKSIVINPMNAPALSQLPLATLQFKGTSEQRFQQALLALAPDLQEGILACLPLFMMKGRDALSEEDKVQLNRYFRHSASPIAQDIIHWLDGAYQFDPACLT